jgi:methionine-rich copper-binding protein CopC
MPRRLWVALLFGACVAAAAPAWAEGPRMVEASPAARSVMNAQNQEFFIRFDVPVDHHAARLELLRGGEVVRSLHPRLQSQPNTLYATAGSLAPGAYVLRWSVQNPATGARSSGTLDFSVR